MVRIFIPIQKFFYSNSNDKSFYSNSNSSFNSPLKYYHKTLSYPSYMYFLQKCMKILNCATKSLQRECLITWFYKIKNFLIQENTRYLNVKFASL